MMQIRKSAELRMKSAVLAWMTRNRLKMDMCGNLSGMNNIISDFSQMGIYTNYSRKTTLANIRLFFEVTHEYSKDIKKRIYRPCYCGID